MAASAGRRVRDACISLGSVGALIAGIVAIDETCRRYVVDALHGELPDLLAPSVRQLSAGIASVLPHGNNPVLLGVGASAFVLAVLMFRS